MPGGVGGAVQATRFAGGLGAAAAYAGRCLPGVPLAGTGQRGPVCLLVWGGLIMGALAATPGGGLRSASSAGPLLLGAGCGRAGGSLLA